MKKLILALAAVASPASATWREASTKHFVIYSEQSERELRDFATRLERYDSAMRADRGVADVDRGPANRLTVFAVENATAVQRLAGDKGGTIAGFYEPRAGRSVAFMPRRLGNGGEHDVDGEYVLRHEYAHYFMFENFSSIAFPRWFSEGFAELNAGARVNGDGSVDLGLPATHRVYGLKFVMTFTINDLLEPRGKKFSPAELDAFYGRAWLLTDMLTFDPRRKGQLATFLLALNEGKSGMEAAKIAFGNISKLDVDMDSYLKRASFPYKTIPAANVSTGPIAMRQLTAGEEAAMPVRLVSNKGVNPQQAKELVGFARKRAAPYPNDHGAQMMLAEAELDADNYKEAEAAADRALAADRNSVQAHLYKGYAQMRQAKAAKTKDAATWRAVRHWFILANRLDPKNPEPLIAFYDTFQAAGESPSANAVAGLKTAYMLAPQDKDLRWKAARQFLVDGDAAQARIALGPIAYYPEARGGIVDYAAAVLETLKGGDVKAALAQMDHLIAEAKEKAKKAGGPDQG